MRARSNKHKSLAHIPFLYAQKKHTRQGVKIYYSYKTESGSRIGFGTDRNAAIAAAKELNANRLESNDLVQRVKQKEAGSNATNLINYIENYCNVILPRKRFSEKTFKEEIYRINRIKTEFNGFTFGSLKQNIIAKFLNNIQSGHSANKIRIRLIDIYRHAISDGIITDNIPERILPRDLDEVERQDMTFEQYKKIYDCASNEIKAAMALSLNFMQRRDDVRKLERNNYKEFEGKTYLPIEIIKTKNTKVSRVNINLDLPAIHHGETLKDVLENIEQAYNTVKNSPYRVHHIPGRKQESKEKAHWSQLSGKEITNGFNDAAIKAGVFDGLSKKEKPTFHKIIALGQYLRRMKTKADMSLIQKMRGHTTQKTTLYYMNGYDWIWIGSDDDER